MSAFTRQLPVALTILLLTACGGGGGTDSPESESSTSNTSNTISSGQSSAGSEGDEDVIAINGMGVKGPLANAIVSVYAIDNSKADFKGRLLAEGFTNDSAKLFLDVPARHAIEELMLIEYTAGQELSGDTPVIPTLRTVITSQQFLNRTPIYATPLTTLVVDSAIQNVGQGASPSVLTRAMRTSSTQTRRAFGLGLLDSNMDLFTDAPVLTEQTDQQTSLAHRTAIEVFAAVMNQVRVEAQNQGGQISADEVIPAVAEDMQDGELDGKVAGTPVAKLASLNTAHLQTILTTDPNSLAIPGTETPIAELADILASETLVVNPQVRPETLSRPQPEAIEPDFAAQPEPEPEPEPEPQPEPTPPSVSFFTPRDGATITAGNDLGVIIAANDSDGNIERCTLTLNGTSLRVDTNVPYTWGAASDSALENMNVGSYTLSATCVDNDNLNTSASVSITVTAPAPVPPPPMPEPEPEPAPEPDPVAPSVSFFAPANGTSYTTGDDIAVLVSAADSDGSIDRCALTLNGSALRTDSSAPYMWGSSAGDSALSNMRAGNYTLRVTCVDNDNLSRSAQTSVTVVAPPPEPEPEPVPPTVSFSSPAGGTTVTEGDDLSVIVEASDSDGSIASCSLTLNGSAVRTEVNAPYTWGAATSAGDTSLLDMSAGNYTLVANCVDDDNQTSTAEISVTVAAAPEPEPEPPAPAPLPEPEPVTYTANITWTAPTTREDGSSLTPSEIDHYEVYYYLQGSQSGSGEIVNFNPDLGTSGNPATITLDQSGSYVFAISCVDSDGNVSDISDEVIVTIP